MSGVIDRFVQAAFQQHLLAHKQQQAAKQAAAKHAQQAAAAGPSSQAPGANSAAPQGFSADVKIVAAQHPHGFPRSGAQPGSATATMQPPQSRQGFAGAGGMVGSPDIPQQQQRASSVPPHPQQHHHQQPQQRPLLHSPSLPSSSQQQLQQQQQAMQQRMLMQARQVQAQALQQQQQQHMSQQLQQQQLLQARQSFEGSPVPQVHDVLPFNALHAPCMPEFALHPQLVQPDMTDRHEATMPLGTAGVCAATAAA